MSGETRKDFRDERELFLGIRIAKKKTKCILRKGNVKKRLLAKLHCEDEKNERNCFYNLGKIKNFWN